MDCRKILSPWAVLWMGLLLMAGCYPRPASTLPFLALPPSIPARTAAAPSHTPALERANLGDGLSLRQIRKDVFVVTHAFPWPANSLIVEMSNADLVLVGTPYTPAAMTAVLDWITRHFGQRNIIEINPGYHVDNLGGNSALIERGIAVYGSDLTAQLLQKRGEHTRQVLLGMLGGAENERYYHAQATIPYVAPTHLFPIAQGLTLTFSDAQVKVYYPGPSQSPDKVVVYFPRQKVLFGSCMILASDQVGNTADADLKHWPEAVRSLKQFDAEVVVPGHGDRLDPGLIDHTIALLTAQP